MATSETTYYSEGDVLITNARVVLGGKTYSMANVTSVAIGTAPANNKPAIAVLVVGALMAACSMGSSQGIVGVIFGLILAGVGIYLLTQAKPNYVVRLGSSSGESDGLISRDRGYIEKIVKAINDAIIRRG